jgi:hypothetical protein
MVVIMDSLKTFTLSNEYLTYVLLLNSGNPRYLIAVSRRQSVTREISAVVTATAEVESMFGVVNGAIAAAAVVMYCWRIGTAVLARIGGHEFKLTCIRFHATGDYAADVHCRINSVS